MVVSLVMPWQDQMGIAMIPSELNLVATSLSCFFFIYLFIIILFYFLIFKIPYSIS